MMWLNGCWQGAAPSMRQSWGGKCEVASWKRLKSTRRALVVTRGGEP